MKMQITKTEILAMPETVWRKFCDFILRDDIVFTSIQKTASLCAVYFLGIQGDGHSGYFRYHEEVQHKDLVEALDAMGLNDFSRNYLRAVEDNLNDNFDEEDIWFYNNSDLLRDALDEYLYKYIDEFFEIVDENYQLRPPKDGVWVAAIITAVTLICGIIAAGTNPNPADRKVFLIYTTGCFLLIGLLLAVYAIRWKVSVLRDTVTFRYLVRRKKILKFEEISRVVLSDKSIVIYSDGKRVQRVSKSTKEMGMFYAQLAIAEKIEDKQEVGFKVRNSNTKFINNIGWLAICIGMLIWVFTRSPNPASIYEKLFFILLLAVSLIISAGPLLFKVISLENSIYIKRAFRQKMMHLLTDFTSVHIAKQKMHIETEKGVVAKVAEDSVGYRDLFTKLQSTNIPFYINGKRFRYETITIEEQLEFLRSIGITPSNENFCEWLRSEIENDFVPKDPYLVIRFLGGMIETKENRERISADALSLSSDCIVDEGSYAVIANYLSELSKNSFVISQEDSSIDYLENQAVISFRYEEKDYSWKLQHITQEIDIRFIESINQLLLEKNSESFFYVATSVIEGRMVFLFITKEKADIINELTDTPFILHLPQNEDSKSNEYILKQHKSNIKAGVLSLIVFSGISIYLICSGSLKAENLSTIKDVLLYILPFLLTALTAILLLHAIRWRLVIYKDRFTFKGIIGKEKEYLVSSIVKADLRPEKIIVSLDKTKISVNINCENFIELTNLLRRYNIPLYMNGKAI